jgi:hypothetical protein
MSWRAWFGANPACVPGLTRARWAEQYIDTQIMATGGVKEACILGKADGALWATSNPEFVPRAYVAVVADDSGKEKEEMINEADELSKLAMDVMRKPKGGLRINQQKYQVFRAMPNGSLDDGLKTIYFKKAMGGGCMTATRQCIIIGIFDESKGAWGGGVED